MAAEPIIESLSTLPNRAMHPKLQELADHFGVELSERSCENGAVFDGKTLALNGKNGYIGDHRVMHEIAHNVVSKAKQKNKPEYMLGSVPNHWLGVSRILHRSDRISYAESETQELMCHFLCILWGKAYGISVDLPDEDNWSVKNWDDYLIDRIDLIKSMGEVELQWRALVRLRVRGMLNRLPIPT